MSHSQHSTRPSPTWLFVYGTLGPANREDAVQRGFEPDAVRGRLYDLGPYPALVGLEEPDAPWVSGHVRPVTETELQTVLDPYEGVDECLFQRVRCTTQSGRLVWVYVYARPVPEWARRLLDPWVGRRIDPTGEQRPQLPDS